MPLGERSGIELGSEVIALGKVKIKVGKTCWDGY